MHMPHDHRDTRSRIASTPSRVKLKMMLSTSICAESPEASGLEHDTRRFDTKDGACLSLLQHGFCKMATRFVYESAARKVQQLAVTHQATMLSPVPYRVSA